MIEISEESSEELDHSYAVEVEMSHIDVYIDENCQEQDSDEQDDDEVEQDQSFNSKEGAILLYTLGVGPCIAFLASGKYLSSRDHKEHYFAALYHHSGGEQSEIKKEGLLDLGRENLEFFFDGIKTEIGESTEITLHQLSFIGGQKADENCCGTEKEVQALEAVFEQNDPLNSILPDNMHVVPSPEIEFRFFPTYGEAFVDVYVQREGDSHMKVSYVTTDNNPVPVAALAQRAALDPDIQGDSLAHSDASLEQSGLILGNIEGKKESFIEKGSTPENVGQDKQEQKLTSSQAGFFYSTSTPGKRHNAPLPENTPAEKRARGSSPTQN